MTPTPKDNGVAKVLKTVLDIASLAVGKAKNVEPKTRTLNVSGVDSDRLFDAEIAKSVDESLKKYSPKREE